MLIRRAPTSITWTISINRERGMQFWGCCREGKSEIRVRDESSLGGLIMPQTLLYFGIFCLVAAIAGGGLKALGFQMGALNSTLRQIILGGLGIALMVSAEWSPIVGYLVPPKQVTVTQTLTLDAGASVNIPLSLKRAGSVDVVIENESELH